MSDEVQIIYGMIAKGDKPLTSYSEYQGNFELICLKALPNMKEDSTAKQEIKDHIIYINNKRGINYLIMTHKNFNEEAALQCIENIKNEFNTMFPGREFDGEAHFGLDEEFKLKLKEIISKANESPDQVVDSRIESLKEELRSQQKYLIKSTELLDKRGQQLDLIIDKSENLLSDSRNYYAGAVKVRRTEQCKKWKTIIGIVVIILIVIFFILWMVCGITFSNCRSSK